LTELEVPSYGAEALARHLAGAIDLILSDAMMPEMDGHGLLAMLRGYDARTPVVFVSATGHAQCAPPCVRTAAKPFDLHTVLTAHNREDDASAPAVGPDAVGH
jgi:CheY-like chemotaxis protein